MHYYIFMFHYFIHDNRMLSGDADGIVYGFQIVNSESGTLQDCARRQLKPLSLHRVQWYPIDQSLFCVTQPTSVALIDSVRFDVVDEYRFEGAASNTSLPSASSDPLSSSSFRFDRRSFSRLSTYKRRSTIETGSNIPKVAQRVPVYWSDWNQEQPKLIAVAMGESNVRIVDVRVGSAVQQLHVKAVDAQLAHHVTRSLWAADDADALLLGDSAGFLHIYDLRRTKSSLQTMEGISGQPIGTLQHMPDRHRLLVAHGHAGRPAVWTFRRKRLWLQPINLDSGSRPGNRQLGAGGAYIHCQMAVTDRCLIRPITDPVGEVRVQSLTCGSILNTFVSPHWTPADGGQRSTCTAALHRKHVTVYSGGKNGLKVWAPAIKSDDKDAILEQVHADAWSDSD